MNVSFRSPLTTSGRASSTARAMGPSKGTLSFRSGGGGAATAAPTKTNRIIHTRATGFIHPPSFEKVIEILTQTGPHNQRRSVVPLPGTAGVSPALCSVCSHPYSPSGEPRSSLGPKAEAGCDPGVGLKGADPMPVTRADFLRYSSLAAGLTAVALSQSGLAQASASPAGPGEVPLPPDGPDGLLDSQRFRRAVEQGDLSLVKSYLERDPALAMSRDERGRSVFVLASLAGHSEIAEALQPFLGSLDLVEAVLAGDAKRVAELVGEHPRLVNEIHPAGGSAVHMAVRRRSEEHTSELQSL